MSRYRLEPTREQESALLRHCEHPVWKATPALRHDFERLAQQLAAGPPARAETQFKILLNSLLFDLLQMLKTRRIALQPSLASTRRSSRSPTPTTPKTTTVPRGGGETMRVQIQLQ